ncbi:hypothetical protein [Kitasatospora kifunensis]|uniref:PknH-like extracellular domain-containing protein n=1 Tax=Kitasatospora kifunensis TaxID=58351 RepID=A0A7W7QXB1_KITKI|nr:hypothetical protein [Kitasatospora kifunensis]MBB4921380.1 hypothetical protein [Kitasatospora kifunensis]
MPGLTHALRSAGPARPAGSALRARATLLAAVGALAVLATVSGCGGATRHSAAAPGGVPGGVPATATPTPPAAVTAPAVSTQLSADQLPAGAVERWQPLAAPRTQAVTGAIQVNECASITGAVSWQQQAYVSAYRTPAEQDLFRFQDGPAARAAYQNLLTQMASCQDQSRALQAKALGSSDALVTQTAATGQGIAWSRQWTGVEGISAAGPQTDHLYAVQQGSALAVVHFDEWAGVGTAPYSTRADGDLLTSVAHRLG